MKRATPALAAIVLSACSSVTTNLRYDDAFRFDQVETFKVQPLPTSVDVPAFHANRLQEIVTRTLTRRGYTETDGKANVTVTLQTEFLSQVHGNVKRDVVIRLTIEFLAGAGQHPVWTSTSDIVRENLLPEAADARLVSIIEEMLAEFPP